MNAQHDEPNTPGPQPSTNLGTSVGSVAAMSTAMSTAISMGNRGKTPLTSQKLGRTLKELESAFNEWESLGAAGDSGDSSAGASNAKPAAAPAETGNVEFRVKTKKLLSQLREQLDELNE